MLLARFTCSFIKCDKVRVIVAWGKNCREESDKVFPIGYQVCIGTCRVLTAIQYLDSLVEHPSTPFSVYNQHRFSLP